MIRGLKHLATLFQRPTSGDAASSADILSSSAIAPHLIVGQRGESLAAQYLQRSGYRLVASNFKIPIGRNRRGALIYGEIDLVAYEGETLSFIEVKTRTSDAFAAPETAVDRRKERQITRAARAYRRAFGLQGAPYRYDVLSIVLSPGNGREEMQASPSPKIELLRNFWTDAKFRKRRWQDAPDDF